jgi:hypothetical protein
MRSAPRRRRDRRGDDGRGGPDLDRSAGARLADAIPTAEVVHVERASHGMMTDLEDALGVIVGDWLAAHALI